MNKLIVLFFGVLVVACGRNEPRRPSQERAPVIGPTGPVGPGGAPGIPGLPGLNSLVEIVASDMGGGASCVEGGVTLISGLDTNRDSHLQPAEVTASVDICNGLVETVSVTEPTILVNPCGDAPNMVDEVFVKLSNGTLLASMSANVSGDNTRLVVLAPGRYQTTDGDVCQFTVTPEGEITDESHTY